MPNYKITKKTVNVTLFINHDEFDSAGMSDMFFVGMAYRQIANDFPMILTFDIEWMELGFEIKLTHKAEF